MYQNSVEEIALEIKFYPRLMYFVKLSIDSTKGSPQFRLGAQAEYTPSRLTTHIV
jgi:hypothetical protein